MHVVVSSPPVKFGCHYGIDTTGRGELVANVKSVEEIREMIGSESLVYLSLEGMVLAIERARRSSGSGSRGSARHALMANTRRRSMPKATSRYSRQ